jgi:hypothetical protein
MAEGNLIFLSEDMKERSNRLLRGDIECELIKRLIKDM